MFEFYVKWFNSCGCEIQCEGANTMEEIREELAEMVKNADVGDKFVIEERS
jgi:hypothetical protein